MSLKAGDDQALQRFSSLQQQSRASGRQQALKAAAWRCDWRLHIHSRSAGCWAGTDTKSPTNKHSPVLDPIASDSLPPPSAWIRGAASGRNRKWWCSQVILTFKIRSILSRKDTFYVAKRCSWLEAVPVLVYPAVNKQKIILKLVFRNADAWSCSLSDSGGATV